MTDYRDEKSKEIVQLLEEFECQPILFVGSGISRRYIDAPNWMELLKIAFKTLPNQGYEFEYLRQKFDDEAIVIGTELSQMFFEWAWGEGKSNYPSELFQNGNNKDVFLKFTICEILKEYTLKSNENIDQFSSELVAAAEIRPHAIITTNYDRFLQIMFEGYEVISGQKILKYNTNYFGEIFHIHGDVNDFRSIILTEADYNDWSDKKKYVAAKLLTFFAEHPVFIFGYSLSDPNVAEILRDIGEIIADENGVIPNVYQIIWTEGEEENFSSPYRSFVVDGREFKTKAIYTSEFEWIYEALKSQGFLTSVNPKLVRALAARTMKLVRHDIPAGKVSVDYQVFEKVANEDDHLPALLGITTADNPNHSHPFTITQAAQKLGFDHCHPLLKMLKQIEDDTGINLKATDNDYHIAIKTGNSSTSHKYSQLAHQLFKDIKEGKEYSIAEGISDDLTQ